MLTARERRRKLEQLAKTHGSHDVYAFCDSYLARDVVPGICVQCDHLDSVAHDEGQGVCPTCATNTVVSCLVLKGYR
jgi:hypothetical protein